MTETFHLSRTWKRLLVWAADTALVPLCLYAAFALRLGTLTPMGLARAQAENSALLLPLMAVLGGVVIVLFRLPQIKLNAFENRAMMQIGMTAMTLVVVAISCSYLLQLFSPRSVPLIFGALFFLAAVGMRMVGLAVLSYLYDRKQTRVRVAIYGAGSAGIQMAAALQQSDETRPLLFLDDNPALQGLMVAGLPVHAPRKLGRMITRHQIQRVLIAMPSVHQDRARAIVAGLGDLPVEVQTLPSYGDMMTSRNPLDALQPVTPDALLGRDKVELDTPEIAKTYAGRVVMVTGAGGSIGSELCRQLLACQPARIVLFDQSEFHLYQIDMDLRKIAGDAGIPIVSRLGSITNKARVTTVIADEGVEIIMHAAAYKHVPMVEHNELEGARNNVLGTQIVAEAAAAAGLERMIMISTDKAVSPTNIMGATKRMAELVVQDIQTRSTTTKFAMVRFGNVLGSSGSVLPLFQSQILDGGPVTVTDPEVTRYFMTINEAARLVLLAGAYARGGDMFVLEMGQPQKIMDIARQMIALSGRTLKDPKTGKGDVAIKITGLRPGEKLHEEYLIAGANLVATPHPKILRTEEAVLSQIEVAAMLREIQTSITEGDRDRLRKLVAAQVEGYHTHQATSAALIT